MDLFIVSGKFCSKYEKINFFQYQFYLGTKTKKPREIRMLTNCLKRKIMHGVRTRVSNLVVDDTDDTNQHQR